MPAITMQNGQARYDIEIMGWDGNPYRITLGSVSRTVTTVLQRFITASQPNWYIENLSNHAGNYNSPGLGLVATDGTAWTTTLSTESFANYGPDGDLIQFSFHNKRDGFNIQNDSREVGFKAWDNSNWVFRVQDKYLSEDANGTYQPTFYIVTQ